MSVFRIKPALFLLLISSLSFCSAVGATNSGTRSPNSVLSACISRVLNLGRVLKHPQTLEELLSVLDAPITKKDPAFRLPRVDIDFKRFPRVPAVEAQQIIVGKDGEGYFLLRKGGKTWRRLGGPNFFAVESDPTWIISALGPKVAAFFGFRLVSEDVMYAPNSLLFNNRIVAMNLLLKKKGLEEIPVRWVEKTQPAVSPDGVKLSYSETYVREFYFNDQIPFSPKEIIHDSSHHALDVLWTRDQLGPINARIGALIRFADFVREFNFDLNGYPLLSVPRYREALIALLFQTQARSRDNFSGFTPR